MTVTVTSVEMSTITGMTAEEAGEVGNDNSVRSAKIAEAVKQFERDAQRTFVGTEDDYSTAKEAVAFLAAHLVSRTRMPAVAEGSARSPYLEEYKRLLRNIKVRTEDSNEKYFGGYVKSYETADLDENYQDNGHSS